MQRAAMHRGHIVTCQRSIEFFVESRIFRNLSFNRRLSGTTAGALQIAAALQFARRKAQSEMIYG